MAADWTHVHDTGDPRLTELQRVGHRLNRRELIIAVSALAGARLVGGSESAVSADEAQMHINQPPSGPFAVAGRGQQIQPRWRPGQFTTHVDVEGRRMALTFDDGPSPYNTPERPRNARRERHRGHLLPRP